MERNLTWTNRISPGEGSGLQTEHNSFSVNNHTRRDTWTGPAAQLADMHTIAVYPVGGWWKYRTARDRWKNKVRYSLIVSIDVPDETVDIYSVVETLIETQ